MKLRIAFIVDAWFPFVGGGQIYALELKQIFEEKYECQVTIFAPPHPHILVRLIWSLYLPWYIALKHVFVNYTLIHSQGYNSGWVGMWVEKIIHRPVVHTVHGSNLLDLNQNSIKTKLEKYLLTQIHYTTQITVSKGFMNYQNVNSPKYVPNGVNSLFLKQNRPIKKTIKKIIWIGREDPIKGLSFFNTAVKKLKSKYTNLEIDIILDGRLSQSELVDRYLQADIFVQSSLSEGFSLTVLEAMATKLPVVVTDVGENSSLVKDGYHGYVVEPRNVKEMANAIEKLIKSPIEAGKMGQRGYERVKKTYTWNKVAVQTYEIYKSTLKTYV